MDKNSGVPIQVPFMVIQVPNRLSPVLDRIHSVRVIYLPKELTINSRKLLMVTLPAGIIESLIAQALTHVWTFFPNQASLLQQLRSDLQVMFGLNA